MQVVTHQIREQKKSSRKIISNFCAPLLSSYVAEKIEVVLLFRKEKKDKFLRVIFPTIVVIGISLFY